MAVMSLL